MVSALVLAGIAVRGLWGARPREAGHGADEARAVGEAGSVERMGPGVHAAPAMHAGPAGTAASAAHTGPVEPTGPAIHTRPVKPTDPVKKDGPARTFVRFAALTLINPTTALYFAALTTARGADLSGGAAGAVFVTGVFLASFLWQQLLVAASGFAGARISPAARAWTFRAGYGLVALYAVKVALPLR